MVSISRRISDRANNYNYEYLHCYLETITRTISTSLIILDSTLIFYENHLLFDYIILIAHILSCSLYFLSICKPKIGLVLQFIVITVFFITYSFYNVTTGIALLVLEGYTSVLFRIIVYSCSIIVQIYAFYIAMIYYIRIKNNEDLLNNTTFEDEIEEVNVQLIIDY